MDYEKKLALAKEALDSGSYDKETIEYIFPELKESEDERIRKYLISFVKLNSGVNLPPEDAEQILAWLENIPYTIFPELKENDGEKIRKEIISALKWANHKGVYDKHIAWLEKQSEQILANSAKTCKDEQQPIDKVEPKFKNGQWIVWRDKCYKVNYKGCGYELVDQDGLSTSLEYATIDENAHIWDITKDAKDGDILVSRSPFIYGKQYPYGGLNWYNNNFFKASNFIFTDSPVHPATKEQRDLLFTKMKEAGYEWDAEHKQPKKIEQKPTDNDMKEALRTEYEKGRADAIAEMQKPVDCIDCTNSKGCINCEDGNMKETLVQKPAWSEDDEEELDIAVSTLKEAGQHDSAKWLKSLKGRVQPQPKQEWNKEDESIALGIEQIVNCASLLNIAPDRLNKVRDWLKSLRHQNTWKPSDEQMKALNDINLTGNISYAGQGQVLIELYNDLKKLAEE